MWMEVWRLEPAFCSGGSKIQLGCTKKWCILDTFLIYHFLSIFWFNNMNSNSVMLSFFSSVLPSVALKALYRQAASIILAQWWLQVWEVRVFWPHTGICVVSELILQTSFRVSRERLAILAHDSSLLDMDVQVRCIVFMCLFPWSLGMTDRDWNGEDASSQVDYVHLIQNRSLSD